MNYALTDIINSRTACFPKGGEPNHTNTHHASTDSISSNALDRRLHGQKPNNKCKAAGFAHLMQLRRPRAQQEGSIGCVSTAGANASASSAAGEPQSTLFRQRPRLEPTSRVTNVHTFVQTSRSKILVEKVSSASGECESPESRVANIAQAIFDIIARSFTPYYNNPTTYTML